MSEVVSFTDYRPVARYPPITTPWTQARIDEATADTGPWTTIDTITLSPVDSDPTAPQARSFSTPNATLTSGWYRVVFLDAASNEDITSPVAHNSPSGAPYFTSAELRARYPEVANTTSYPEATITARRQEVEERLERLCDVAFTPRTATAELVSGDGGTRLEVKHTTPRAITSASDAGTTVDLTGVLVADGTFYLPAGWNVGVSNLTVTYTHGYDSPPPAVKEAAMLWVRELLVKGPVTDRATQIPTEDGGVINLATPGLFGSTTGIPAVDEVISEYRLQAFVG
jgi:hypothetical protein